MNLAEQFPVPREGLLPEDYDYALDASNDGCEASPSCLSCPLPACRYESRRPQVAADKNKKYAAIKVDALRMTPKEAARMHNCSVRTVFRALAAA